METAEIAIQSALTGHLVFSTLHTNDAPSAITRLLDMGVESFLLSGRIRAAYGTAAIAGVTGLSAAMPVTGRCFLLAMLALLGLPPFGLFVSEVLIFGAGFRAGHPAVAAAGLGLLVVAFAGLLRATHRMLYGGRAPSGVVEPAGWRAAWPVAAALGLLVVTGVAWPPGLAAALAHVAGTLAP